MNSVTRRVDTMEPIMRAFARATKDEKWARRLAKAARHYRGAESPRWNRSRRSTGTADTVPTLVPPLLKSGGAWGETSLRGLSIGQ